MAHLNGKRPSGAWIAAATVLVVGLTGCNASSDEQPAPPENVAAPAGAGAPDPNAAGSANGSRAHDDDQHEMGAGGDPANHQMMEEHHRLRMDHMRMEEEHNAQRGAHPGGTAAPSPPAHGAAPPQQPAQQPPMQGGMKHE